MSGETGSPSQAELERIPEIPAFQKKDTLQARIAFPGNAADKFPHLNPEKTDVIGFKAEVIDAKASDRLIQQRSNEERAKVTGTVDKWKDDMVAHFQRKEVSAFFKNSDQGKKFAAELNKTLGIDVTNFTKENATKVYADFGADLDKGALNYADKVLSSADTLEELESKLAAFEWFGHI